MTEKRPDGHTPRQGIGCVIRIASSGKNPVQNIQLYPDHFINPLDSKGNYSATSNNTKLVH